MIVARLEMQPSGPHLQKSAHSLVRTSENPQGAGGGVALRVGKDELEDERVELLSVVFDEVGRFGHCRASVGQIPASRHDCMHAVPFRAISGPLQ